MERWLVRFSNEREMIATSQSQASNFAHCDKSASIHHLVEAREQVWVVRDSQGKLAEVWPDGGCIAVPQGYTCRQEWLGGGA